MGIAFGSAIGDRHSIEEIGHCTATNESNCDLMRGELTVKTEWLTANEAAQYLKVKPRTLLQWAREKKIPSHRLSGVERCVWRFLRPELDAMLGLSSADPAEGRQ
jgi:excisionase family DNA binding protein